MCHLSIIGRLGFFSLLVGSLNHSHTVRISRVDDGVDRDRSGFRREAEVAALVHLEHAVEVHGLEAPVVCVDELRVAVPAGGAELVVLVKVERIERALSEEGDLLLVQQLTLRLFNLCLVVDQLRGGKFSLFFYPLGLIQVYLRLSGVSFLLGGRDDMTPVNVADAARVVCRSYNTCGELVGVLDLQIPCTWLQMSTIQEASEKRIFSFEFCFNIITIF